MNDEIIELQNEIAILNKRIDVLERKESHRKSMTYLKILKCHLE